MEAIAEQPPAHLSAWPKVYASTCFTRIPALKYNASVIFYRLPPGCFKKSHAVKFSLHRFSMSL